MSTATPPPTCCAPPSRSPPCRSWRWRSERRPPRIPWTGAYDALAMDAPALDFFDLSGLLTPDEREVQRSTRRFLEAEALPGIRQAWARGEFPRALVPRFGEQNLLGANLPIEQAGAGISAVAYGLINYE